VKLHEPARREPIFNAPAIVVFLGALFIAVHVLLQLLPVDTSDWLFVSLAIVPARFGGEVSGIPGWPMAEWTSLVTHAFVHGDWFHLALNTAWLLVFGSIIARRTSALRTLAMFILCSLAGALLYLYVHPGLVGSLVGASGGIAGLMGGVFRFIFSGMDEVRSGTAADFADVPLPSLAQSLRDTRVLAGIGVWFAMNLLFGLIPAGIVADAAIAWEAHLGGFIAGFLTMGLFDQVARRTGRGFTDVPPAGGNDY